MPTWTSAVLVVLACAVLTWAGLEKIRDRVPLAATFAELGLPPGAAIGVPLVELGTVLAVVLGAPHAVTAALFVAVGTGFAAAGVRSLARGRAITCACFGATESPLGWRQIAALPGWLLAGWAMAGAPGSTLRQRIAVFSVGMLVLSVARGIPALRLGLAARADRRAMAGA